MQRSRAATNDAPPTKPVDHLRREGGFTWFCQDISRSRARRAPGRSRSLLDRRGRLAPTRIPGPRGRRSTGNGPFNESGGPSTVSAVTFRRAVSPVREGFHTITPYLRVQRAEELLDFVKRAFGAEETLRAKGTAGGLHAEVRVGDSMLMMGGFPGMPVDELPTALHLYVPDADVVYRRALNAGASSLQEPTDQPYGDRVAGVRDVAGNYWYIATHKAGAGYVPEGMRAVTPYLHPRSAARLIDYLKQAFRRRGGRALRFAGWCDAPREDPDRRLDAGDGRSPRTVAADAAGHLSLRRGR